MTSTRNEMTMEDQDEEQTSQGLNKKPRSASFHQHEGQEEKHSQQSKETETPPTPPKEVQHHSSTKEGIADESLPPSSSSDQGNISRENPSTDNNDNIQEPSAPDDPSPIEPKGISVPDTPPVNPHFNGDRWFDVQFHPNSSSVFKPKEIGEQIPRPERSFDDEVLRRIRGSMIGMAIGDALGAHVEFRPHEYLLHNPVEDLGSGGTWGLEEGQFTDDTSMALCLALSLIAKKDFDRYDQLVRYQWWYRNGFMSSTGHCFDIGQATRQSIEEFHRRQIEYKNKHSTEQGMEQLDVNCSEEGVAGNGALMRLAPVPLFFFRNPQLAVEYAGQSGRITHGDIKAVDSCRFYAALIVAALNKYKKEEILDRQFFEKHSEWFGKKPLHPDVMNIARGSYMDKDGYNGGIRGKGYIVDALEAALWSFSSTTNFREGALAAVNLGDDTDTTAAIYGQLAGAYYGVDDLDKDWLKRVYAKQFLDVVSQWLEYEGHQWTNKPNPPKQ